MEQIVEKLYEQQNKSNSDALELTLQKGTGEHPYVLMRCGGIKVYDDKSNVIVSPAPEQSDIQPFG